MNNLEDCSLSLPIPEIARQTAEVFAQEQPTPAKAEQVRLNTLAVWIVHEYLQLMGIPTNIAAGDSWNPVMRICADVADLEVIGIGRLECRPHRAQEQICFIPPEVWDDRIGYVVVCLDQSEQEGTILGFASEVTNGELALTQLQSWDTLLVYLHQLRSRTAVAETLVNLSRWLEGVFETGWQTVNDLFAGSEGSLGFSFRTGHEDTQGGATLRRGKLLDLGGEFGSVILVVEVSQREEADTMVGLKLYPTGNRLYLPLNLQLEVLDQSGALFLEAISRSTDNYLQLQVHGAPGERFRVKVVGGNSSVTEEFVI